MPEGQANLFQREFPYLDNTPGKVFLILFCASFGTLFLLLYNPLDVSNASINTILGLEVDFRYAGVIGGLGVALTQFGFRRLFGLNEFTLGKFLGWLVFEMIFLSILFYIAFGDRSLPLFDEFMVVAVDTVLISVIIYGIAILVLALFKANSKDESDQSSHPSYLTLKDEKGKVMITLKEVDLIYLKAEDNYIQVVYLQNGELERRLIRTSLKKLLKEIPGFGLIRIHRSFAVNLANVASVKRNKGKYEVHMNHVSNSVLPVSTTYEKALEQVMTA